MSKIKMSDCDTLKRENIWIWEKHAYQQHFKARSYQNWCTSTKNLASKKLCFLKSCLGISMTTTVLHLLCLPLCSPYSWMKMAYKRRCVTPVAQIHLQDQALPQTEAERSGFPIPNAFRSWTGHSAFCLCWCRGISRYSPAQFWAAQELYWKKSKLLRLPGFKWVLWTIHIRCRCLNFAPIFLWTGPAVLAERPACKVTNALKMARLF